MKTNLQRFIGLMVFAVLAISAAVPGERKKEIRLDAKQTVVFFDDFSGETLDRSKWNVLVSSSVLNNEQQTYVDSSATVYVAHGAEAEGARNGALVIRSVFHAGYQSKAGTFDFLSGRINTRGKMEFTYGCVSARMKLPVGEGYWPAFWALGVGKWPDCGEIDLMENVGESDWISAALHGPGYFGETPIVNKVYLKAGKNIAQWHVYSVDWDTTSLAFRVDGVLFYRVTKPMIENYGRWAFENPKYLILNLALGGAYPYKINRVKVPYNGLPETTVNDIKAGNGKLLIDWVKVTR